MDVAVSTEYAHIRPIQEVNQLPWTYMKIKAFFCGFYVLENVLVGLGTGFDNKANTNSYFWMTVAITFMSVMEIFLALIGWTNEVFVGLSVVRAITLIELLKLTRFWEPLKAIIHSLFETLKGVLYLFILLFIVLANYALLGNQLFGKQEVDSSTLSGTFNTFPSSFLLTFALLTGDNWTGFMFDTVKESKDTLTKTIAVFYFISFVVIGNFILMNVFLGIIVDNLTNDFEESHEEHFEEEKRKQRLKLVERMLGTKSNMKSLANEAVKGNNTSIISLPLKSLEKPKMSAAAKLVASDDGVVTIKSNAQNIQCSTSNLNDTPIKNVHQFVDQTIRNTTIRFEFDKSKSKFAFNATTTKSITNSEDEEDNPHNMPHDYTLPVHSKARTRAFSMMLNPEISHPIPHHRALFLFPHTSEFRRYVFYVVTSSRFTFLVCTSIVASCSLMALDDPLHRDPEFSEILNLIDNIFTGIYIAQSCILSNFV